MGTATFDFADDINGVDVIPTITIDDFLKQDKYKLSGRILVKIDTEGFEVDVLKGMLNLLKTKKVTLWVEVTGETWLEVYTLLTKMNYYLVDYVGMNFLFIQSEKHQIKITRLLTDVFNRIKTQRKLVNENTRLQKEIDNLKKGGK